MQPARFDSALLGVALALLPASDARAQPVATSLQQLQSLRSARAVAVRDGNGHEFRGTIAEVSQSRLCLQIGHEVRCFDTMDVASMRVRKEDSLVNGALIGAALGAGFTSVMLLDNECRDDSSCHAAIAVYGGIGAAAGFIVDALVHGSLVVYAAPSRNGPVVSLGPMGRRGVRLKVMF